MDQSSRPTAAYRQTTHMKNNKYDYDVNVLQDKKIVHLLQQFLAEWETITARCE